MHILVPHLEQDDKHREAGQPDQEADELLRYPLGSICVPFELQHSLRSCSKEVMRQQQGNDARNHCRVASTAVSLSVEYHTTWQVVATHSDQL
jgi:hypothetical protein